MKVVAGDNVTLKVTCKRLSDKSIIDLTGATVRLKFKVNDGSLVTQVMTVPTPANGQAQYKFATNELTVGEVDAEVEITDVSTNVFTNLIPLHIGVRSRV